MHIVRYFGNKRLVEYLKNGMNVLISFENHGMGDCVMFIPLYNRLKETYPNVNFSLKCGPGQEIFNDINCDSFDYCFVIEFPEFYFKRDYGSFDGMSKPEICAVYELGIPFDSSIEFTWHPDSICNSEINVNDNTIGVAFQVTSNPNKSINYDCAKVIWEMIKEYGYTPLEVHFEHGLGNPRNKKYDFIDNTCRNYEPNIDNVIGVINKCKGFIGVNTGTFCMATSMKNGNTLHMFKIFHFCPGYKKFNPVMEIDCRNVDFINKTIFEEYIRKIK
jgi:hypothetical protein